METGEFAALLIVVLALVALALFAQKMLPRALPNLLLTEPVTRSGRFTFRAPEPGDIEALIALSIEPHSMEANGWTGETARSHAKFLRSRGFESFRQVAVLAETSTGEIVGVASLAPHAVEGGPHDLSIGIHVSADHQGQGIATELMAVMINAVQERRLDVQTWVGTATTNIAMQRVMKRLGFEPVPGAVPFNAPNGNSFPSIWYAVGGGVDAPTLTQSST